MATSSTVPGSMTGTGNVPADTVEATGPGSALTRGALPSAQTITTVNNQHVTPFTVQPAGTTEALSQYASMFYGLTYGSSPAVLELVWSSGYNPWQLITPGEAAVYTTIHPDAGDTNISGAHGIEWLLTFHDTAGHEVNAIEMVAVRNSTTSCNLTFRCGLSAGGSFILFTNSTGSKTYFGMGPVYTDNIWAYTNMIFQGSSLVVGNAALATTATTGFLYLPSCPGAPTGVPATQTGTVACVLDSTDSKLWAYIGGSWKGVVLS